MRQNRLKSPIFWSSLLSQILSILVLTDVIGSEWSTAISGIVAAVLEAFTVFGLLNNPTDKQGF
ncbi:MAG TPA: phage holin [Oscillospiraceae bacterium]|nr:phage holin [Oscillospiraceae bacterium]HPK35943.1 phage holin [Oscillospiraceae bacterium]HPR75636.1 phage holin [Oscillospiraceae bacterium]